MLIFVQFTTRVISCKYRMEKIGEKDKRISKKHMQR